MNELHYDEETLIGYLDNPMSGEHDDLQEHVQSCSPCQRLFESVQEFFLAMNDSEVWTDDEPMLMESEPDPAKLQQFLDAAERMSQEDDAAEGLVPMLLSEPAQAWAGMVQANVELRTLAVVRKLAEESRKTRETAPTIALQIAELAVSVAEGITIDRYNGDAVFQVQGLCWKETANALRYLGRQREALKALDRSETCYAHTTVCHFDLACVAYVRGTLLFEIERIPEALALARSSAQTFLAFGDHKRFTDARILEGAGYFQRRDFSQARDIWMELLKPVQTANDLETLARLFNNVGHCLVELNDLDTAGTYFLQAMLLYQDLGMKTEKIRSRWGLGRLLLQSGRYEDAISRFRHTRAEFEELEMIGDAAIVSLDIAEALVASGQTAEVPSICQALVQQFTLQGMSSNAATALAYLQEAVAAQKVTPKLVRHVRNYLEDLPSQPARLFAPPPS